MTKAPAPSESFAESHQAAEGASADSTSGMGSRESLQDMLLSTDPSQPLSVVESPWNPRQGGLTRVYRGIQKMSGFGGTPAIADVLIGVAEILEQEGYFDDDSENAEQADDESGLSGLDTVEEIEESV